MRCPCCGRSGWTGDEIAGAFAEWLGLAPTPSKLLAQLYRAKGSLVPTERLVIAADSTLGSVKVAMVRVRRALDDGGVISTKVDGGGYALTPGGLSECREALETLAAERAAA